ncbi:MAG: Sfum_1244 family protein [Pseudomonadota bacterium]
MDAWTASLAAQVRRNCEISDATHAGLYSICGLALRLRDLYKWAHGLPPWKEGDPGAVLSWIDAQETLWAGFEDAVFSAVTIDGRTFDPFDTAGINAVLAARGLFYGAGYAHSLKPAFLLADITAQTHAEGIPVLRLGREWARDLLTLPAFVQDGAVVFRREAARLYLWDQILYIKPSGRPALDVALRRFGLRPGPVAAVTPHLDALMDHLEDLYIYHECGEKLDTVFDDDLWREIIAAFPHSAVELFARTVKDLLADTHPRGPLRRVIENRDAVALGCYVAFFDGLGRALFPELRAAFSMMVGTGGWAHLDDAVDAGRAAAARAARRMSALYLEGKARGDLAWAAARIQEELVCPLNNSRTGAA